MLMRLDPVTGVHYSIKDKEVTQQEYEEFFALLSEPKVKVVEEPIIDAEQAWAEGQATYWAERTNG